MAALALLAAACTDQPTANAPEPVAGPGGAPASQLLCSVTVSTGALECAGDVGTAPGGPRSTLYGGQNSLVRLSSANADTTGGVFEVDVTVTNLLASQAVGTVDGVTAHANGVRVFFATGPTVSGGSGTVVLANADGDDFFTEPEQPYFQWNGVLAPGATSAAKPWRFALSQGVTRFSFVVYVSTEVQNRLVISELMANPAGTVQDSLGEYVEVYNAGAFAVNLRNYAVRDNGGSTTIGADVIVPAGGYAVLGRSVDPAKNGGITVDYAYTATIGTTSSNLQFSNSGADRFVIRAPTGVIADSVSYTSSGTVAKNGVARELTDVSLDNVAVDGASWTDATNVYDATNNNRGTPGTSPTGGGSGPPPVAGPVTTVTVTPASQTLAPGTTRQYTAVGRDGTGQVVSTTFTWSSTNEAVATVSATGMVTTLADGSTTIRATSANGVLGSTTLTVATASTGSVYRNHLEFGVPTDANASDDILLNKTTYSLSYNSARGGPNWVSWNLNSTHFGGANRCNCFAADPTLPAGATVITTSDYTGSGYSRGHMVMSEQRTATPGENESTFFMTNILPQLQDMNGGPWLKFEVYTNDLARVNGKEVYNIAG
ncbi:DNA/RNA non-specific endonuclease, partial [Longimicrobium sp.]|uniref:DNA/RNA non-specific endonuclease n=1 Tax=Longimicrobium sp. TaxID=2029185 RepID=UPI002E349E63